MNGHDPRVDACIAKSAEFARPILEHLRERVHAACPAVVTPFPKLPPAQLQLLLQSRA